MRKLILFSILIFSFLVFPKTLLVPEEFLRIQEAVFTASDGDTISVNFGRPYRQQTVVGCQRIMEKEITFETRGEVKNDLLEIIKGLNNPPNPTNTDQQTRPSNWQGQQQVNEPDDLYDWCCGNHSLIFDNQYRPWVFWKGKPQDSVSQYNIWVYYTMWDDQGWTSDKIALALPGPERWDAYISSATFYQLENHPYLVSNIADPNNLDDIYYTCYNGSEWEPKRIVNLPDSTEVDFRPDIAANENQMWANWFGGVNTVSRYDIYTSRWNGNGWTLEEIISSADYHNWFQKIAVDSRGNPHVVWVALDIIHPLPREDVIFYRYYDGSRWCEPETVMKGMLLYQGFHWSGVDIELDEEDNPHVIFDAKDTNALTFNVFYTKKINANWIEPVRITNDEYEALEPIIAISNPVDIWTVWWRKQGNPYMKASHYNGQNWSPEISLDGNLSYYNCADDLKFDPQGRLWLIYGGYPYGRAENEIYYDVYSTSSLNETPQNYKFQVKAIAPNPFSYSTTISYNLTNPAPVRIEVFDKLGKRVNLLETNYKLPGSYKLNWAGKDQDGKKLSNGIYFISLKLGKEKKVIPVILAK